MYANKITSTRNHVPYDYYSLPFCETNVKKDNPKHLSLGQILLGERSELTKYDLKMDVPETCKILCEKTYSGEETKLFQKRIKDRYVAKMILDNLPVVFNAQLQSGETRVQLGSPIGYMDPPTKKTCLFNHLSFTVHTHVPKPLYKGSTGNRKRVVEFSVKPMSVNHKRVKDKKGLATCPVAQTSEPMCFTAGNGATVTWTYDVAFEAKALEWATRWDPLLKAKNEVTEIQWFAIINSLMITLFLTAMVAMILLRTVYLDFARYNNIDDDEEIQEESGWKLIHGDVFRPPAFSGLLCVLVGSGAQILVMSAVTLVFALVGFLSPANRGGLLTAMLVLWMLASTVCGYFSARTYSGLSGTNKKSVTVGSALFFSTAAFSVFFMLNLILWASGSSGAVPFFTLLLLLVMWLGISVPLNIVGAFVGYKQKAYEYPVRTNQIPREIPNYSRSSNLVFSAISGVLPFGVVFIELFFILTSIYQNELLYVFGFIAAVFVVLVVTCAEVSVVLTYLQLSKESYHWWWPSFLSTGSSGVWVFVYSLIFLYNQAEPGTRIHIVSSLIYMGYTLIFSFAFALATGCIGFLASFKFVRKIYASVHID